MVRRQTIDRDGLLDAAERVVMRNGAMRLTVEAVAAEAGVSKGGLLYTFPTKDALVDALFGRAFSAFEAILAEVVSSGGDSPANLILGHVMANRDAGPQALERAIALIVNFIRAPEYRAMSLEYYQDILGRLDTSTIVGRKARLALLATEGALTLRGFGLATIVDDDWRSIHDDIVEILLS